EPATPEHSNIPCKEREHVEVRSGCSVSLVFLSLSAPVRGNRFGVTVSFVLSSGSRVPLGLSRAVWLEAASTWSELHPKADVHPWSCPEHGGGQEGAGRGDSKIFAPAAERVF
ncbi:unnamed protein product, partial [Hapterophycus canaliculatus]